MLVIKTTQNTCEKKFHKAYYSTSEITALDLFYSGRTLANSGHWWQTLEGESVRVDLGEG